MRERRGVLPAHANADGEVSHGGGGHRGGDGPRRANRADVLDRVHVGGGVDAGIPLLQRHGAVEVQRLLEEPL